MSIARYGGFALLLFCAAAARAQSDLANTSVASINEPRSWTIDVRGLFHRSAEDRTYVSAGFRYGLQPGWEIGVRGSFAPVGNANSVAAIRTGGRDVELMARYSPKEVERLVLMGGVSFPNTPSQDKPFVTAGVAYGLPNADQKFRIVAGARGVFREDSSIIGLSGGAEFSVGQNIDLFGDITGIVHGDNTRDTVTGIAKRQAVWGIGARFNFMSNTDDGLSGSIFALFGNGLGITTGTSLSPALGNRAALTIGVSLRGKS